jgi:hypothetical protein
MARSRLSAASVLQFSQANGLRFQSCALVRSNPHLPQSFAVELPAACRKALSVHEGRLQDFVLQQMTEETPRPSL